MSKINNESFLFRKKMQFKTFCNCKFFADVVNTRLVKAREVSQGKVEKPGK